MIKINLNETYKAKSISKDLKKISFNTILQNGEKREIHVALRNATESFLPNLFNLSFGPLDKNNKIDRKAKLQHQDINKFFSTIFLFVISFLESGRDENYAIGIDNSNRRKATIYHKIFQQNYNYLSEIINTAGIDYHAQLFWQARLSDNSKNKQSFKLFKAKPESFDIHRNSTDLYQYYIFSLNTPNS